MMNERLRLIRRWWELELEKMSLVVDAFEYEQDKYRLYQEQCDTELRLEELGEVGLFMTREGTEDLATACKMVAKLRGWGWMPYDLR